MTKWYLRRGNKKYIIQVGNETVLVTVWVNHRMVDHGVRLIRNRRKDLKDFFMFNHEQFFLNEFRPMSVTH